MIQIAVAIAGEVAFEALAVAAANAAFRGLQRAGYLVSKEAADSIEISDKTSQPGRPVHSRRGKSKRAIRYEVDREAMAANVGFSGSIMGTTMAVHEHGGTERGQRYEPRPVMGPALERTINQLAGGFEDSL